MKFFHLSDLHIGKKVNGFSMLDDQVYILKQILEIVSKEKPDAILIAGDIYDKSIPSSEAVSLLDEFLYRLSLSGGEIFIISGNHDSAERLAFGARLMEREKIHISPVYSGEVKPFFMEDEYGKLAIYMLPFIKPINVRIYFGEESGQSYNDAVRTAVSHMNVDTEIRNIIIAHQFVTGAIRSDSEEISVGGSDNISVDIFDNFDYVALGHIHKPQSVGRDSVRYSGTPLKYSFSEIKHKKSITIVELREKGNLEIRSVELKPLYDMEAIKGTYMELTSRNFYENLNTDNYFKITLTDEEDVPDAMSRLRSIYHRLMQIEYENIRTSANNVVDIEISDELSPVQLFEEFYKKQNGKDMIEEQREYMTELIREIWENEK